VGYGDAGGGGAAANQAAEHLAAVPVALALVGSAEQQAADLAAHALPDAQRRRHGRHLHSLIMGEGLRNKWQQQQKARRLLPAVASAPADAVISRRIQDAGKAQQASAVAADVDDLQQEGPSAISQQPEGVTELQLVLHKLPQAVTRGWLRQRPLAQ